MITKHQNYQHLLDIVEKHCSLGSGMLAATSHSHDIDDVIKELKIPDVLIVVAEIKFALDPVNYGIGGDIYCCIIFMYQHYIS